MREMLYCKKLEARFDVEHSQERIINFNCPRKTFGDDGVYCVDKTKCELYSILDKFIKLANSQNSN